MRSPAVLVLTALLLTSTALVHVAEAGPKGGPGGGGKGPHSAPAPHAAAPAHQPRAAAAPHSAAPRVAAPHGPGPGARMAAPHAAAPRIARTCCTTAATSSCRPTACFPPGSRRRSGPRVEAPRCWPEPDGRLGARLKINHQGSDGIQLFSRSGTSGEARRCTFTCSGRTHSAATSRLKGNPLATRSLIMVAPRVKLAQSPSPLSPQIATEIEMQIGR